MERFGRCLLWGARILPKLPFVVTLVIVLVMAVATFVEKQQGSDFIYSYVYGTWWFAFLWMLAAAAMLVPMCISKSFRKNLALLILHAALVVILFGALITKISAVHGYVTLKPHNPTNTIFVDGKLATPLPFYVKLDTFYVETYAGTSAPSDYVSVFRILDMHGALLKQARVSMNRIFSYQGYRFYQSSYDMYDGSSLLTVNRDVWGIRATYLGYSLFGFAALLLLFWPWSPFVVLLKELNKSKKATLLVLLSMFAISSKGQALSNDELAPDRSVASKFGQICVLHNDRVIPLSSFAYDFALKLTGNPCFNRFNAEQFLMGWLFFPDKWQHIAIFCVKNSTLRKELNATKADAALVDFYDTDGSYKLEKYWNELDSPLGSKSAFLKEVRSLNDRIQLISMLHNGSLLKIYPIREKGAVRWFFPTENLRTKSELKHMEMVRSSLVNVYNGLKCRDTLKVLHAIGTIRAFQQQQAGEQLPSPLKRQAERLYCSLDIVGWLFKINLSAALILLVLSFLLAEVKMSPFRYPAVIVLLLAFVSQTFQIMLRTYIGGRLPFSNGFETMLLIAWCAMLLALIAACRVGIRAIIVGLLVSGLALLVAHLGMMNPTITPLVPVLSSPLLSIHVSVIMLSYTLLAFIAINSLISILKFLFYEKRTAVEQLQKSVMYNKIGLYPATSLLGVGIFIGAIWANVSWGRYWGWDPKEVWALISFLVYMLPLHNLQLRLFLNPLYFHIFCLFAFSTVLMTYFGVNYYLGGLHSYAGAGDVYGVSILMCSIFLGVLIVALLAIRRYTKYCNGLSR